MMTMRLAASLYLLIQPTQLLAAPTSSENVTITLPTGARIYTNPGEICAPASWSNIIVFYLTNYLAHIATVRMAPDQSPWQKNEFGISCLFFPAIGLEKAIYYILGCSSLAREPLQKAARAGALFHVVRTTMWKPKPGDHLENCVLFDDGHREDSINGTCYLRKLNGYRLMSFSFTDE
jgi:hypothetical protein